MDSLCGAVAFGRRLPTVVFVVFAPSGCFVVFMLGGFFGAAFANFAVALAAFAVAPFFGATVWWLVRDGALLR